MASVIERLTAAYVDDKRFVLATSKAAALQYVASLRAQIEQMDEVERFPEGAMGIVVYALLAREASTCPDVGDFGHVLQGIEKVTRLAFDLVREQTFGR